MSEQNKLWAVSILTDRLSGSVRTYSHSAFVVSAASKDEAVGKSYRIALKCYPASEGWRGHGINVYDCSQGPIDPELAKVTFADY